MSVGEDVRPYIQSISDISLQLSDIRNEIANLDLEGTQGSEAYRRSFATLQVLSRLLHSCSCDLLKAVE